MGNVESMSTGQLINSGVECYWSCFYLYLFQWCIAYTSKNGIVLSHADNNDVGSSHVQEQASK